MTRVTTDRALTVEASFVQIAHHLNHPTRCQLGWLVIFIEAGSDVAVIAFHGERAGDEGHRRIQLGCRNSFENLNVFEALFGGLLLSERSGDWKSETDDENQQPHFS